MVDRHEHKAFNDPDRPKSRNSDRIVSRPHDRLSAIEKVSGGSLSLERRLEWTCADTGWRRVQDDVREASRYPLLVHLLATVEALTDAFSARGVDEDRVDELLNRVIDAAEQAKKQWKTGEISVFWEPEA